MKTLVQLSADEIQKLVYNRKMKISNFAQMEPDTKFAIILLEFDSKNPDYSAIATSVRSIDEVTSANLLIDGVTPVSIPVNTEIKVVTDLQVRIDSVEEA